MKLNSLVGISGGWGSAEGIKTHDFSMSEIFLPSCFPSVGLRHVSDDQKTHKNPNLRSQATPTNTKSTGAVNSPKAAVQKRPPLLELEGKKWRVVRKMVTVSLRDCSQRKTLFSFLPPSQLMSQVID